MFSARYVSLRSTLEVSLRDVYGCVCREGFFENLQVRSHRSVGQPIAADNSTARANHSHSVCASFALRANSGRVSQSLKIKEAATLNCAAASRVQVQRRAYES